jgi:hypothetical protein
VIMGSVTPTHEALQALVGRALVDPSFRAGLLNGHRAECLTEYPLSAEEERAASSIQAGDLTSFASQLDHWITDHTRREQRVALLAAGRVRMAAAA